MRPSRQVRGFLPPVAARQEPTPGAVRRPSRYVAVRAEVDEERRDEHG